MDDDTSRPFPDFLEPTFPEDDLQRAEASIAVIEPQGNILWVNRFWRRFAEENGGGPWRLGKGSYFDGIAAPLRDYYRCVFENVLATGEAFDQEYECSSPREARHYHLRVLPIDKRALLLEHGAVAVNPHGPDRMARAETDYAVSPGGTILQCSNCRRVQRPGTRAWDWVPALVASLHPRVSHGICPSCVGFYWGGGRARKK
jgi:hypothetical protein